ncbi:MAG: hypothetical protein CBD16_01455, partial [Betaproteobacteria bacterium TMED156]
MLNTQKKNIENSLFFSKVIKRISDLLSTVTVDGYVFKVDLRLRPHAAMGPTSISINGLKDYFIKDAMTWERFSWTKARVVNSPFIQKSNEFKKHINQLNKLKDEFVFRSYPDFESLESIRNLNKKIKSQHKISGEKNRNGYIFNVKLESGAIRDIEFLVQVQQLVRGGNNHALKSSSTLITLKELSRLEFISSTNEEKIFEAYKFWRTIEHHIQYCFNSQLHTLNVDNIKKITKSLRISSTTKLKQEIVDNQKKIISILNKTLNIHKSNDLLFNQNFSKMPIANFEKKLITNSHSSYDELICSLRKKPSYSRMLDEYPSIQEKIFNITNESLWIADYIKKHPSILDQLLKDTFSTKQIDFKKVKNDLE